MVSFKGRLVTGLQKRGIDISQDLDDRPYQAVLLIGGTRQLARLWKIHRQGIPIVQRLDGMNWLHRLMFRRNGSGINIRYYLRSEYGNWILKIIRNRLATRLVYQSHFVQKWWERKAGQIGTPFQVIYNGVNLNLYSPQGAHSRPEDRLRILLVEGSLLGGYEWGLRQAIQLAEKMHPLLCNSSDIFSQGVELMVVGKVDKRIQQYWQAKCQTPIIWRGQIPSDEIPSVDRSAHLLYSADIHPACPNAVIEALACGLPVLAFDTGAMNEIVKGDAGRVVPYGGDPWRLDEPDIQSLVEAGLEIAKNQWIFRSGARQRAEEAFDEQWMVERYLGILR
ncbi:MAG: glycosyltransferase family 4 protein [Anaerolineales bacterium]